MSTTKIAPREAAREKGKNGGSAKSRKQGLSSTPKLERTTFKTSRAMDFFSERELVTQTGHSVDEWPFVIVKEAVDNALDACEEADIPPEIEVRADATGITVRDNGPGLPESTLEGALDFTIRTSNREAYVAPDRGAQGNALKTLAPMGWVLDPVHGCFIVEAHGKRRTLTVGADAISQEAVVRQQVEAVESNKTQSKGDTKGQDSTGTVIRVQWGEREDYGGIVWPFDELNPVSDSTFAQSFRRIVEGFALFNPRTRRSHSIGSVSVRRGRRRIPPGKSGSRASPPPRIGMKNGILSD